MASGMAAGIKKNQMKDLGLLYSEVPAVAAGVFTTNRVKAAPVLVSMERVKSGKARAVLMNSGCANACTGRRGITDARQLTRLIASSLKIEPESVLLASTGVIGKPLPLEVMEKGIPNLVASLSPSGLGDAALAIMTTDTVPKAVITRGRGKWERGYACGDGQRRRNDLSPNGHPPGLCPNRRGYLPGRPAESLKRRRAGIFQPDYRGRRHEHQ